LGEARIKTQQKPQGEFKNLHFFL
jgi:hypothetical protein